MLKMSFERRGIEIVFLHFSSPWIPHFSIPSDLQISLLLFSISFNLSLFSQSPKSFSAISPTIQISTLLRLIWRDTDGTETRIREMNKIVRDFPDKLSHSCRSRHLGMLQKHRYAWRKCPRWRRSVVELIHERCLSQMTQFPRIHHILSAIIWKKKRCIE